MENNLDPKAPASLNDTLNAIGAIMMVRSNEFWKAVGKMAMNLLKTCWQIIKIFSMIIFSILAYVIVVVIYAVFWYILFVPIFYLLRLLNIPIKNCDIEKVLLNIQK